jgi:LPS-assembly protein
LAKDSNPRYYLKMKDHTRWNEHWRSDLNVNYVSDNYYPQDYGDISSDQNQLFNQFSVNYLSKHWKFTGLLQAYQTLHTFNGQSTDLNQDQYRRLPELDFTADYPNVLLGNDFTLNAQAVNFAYASDFTPERPVGQRIHFQPGLSKSINWSYGYVQPAVSLDTVQYYSVKDFIDNKTVSPSRTLPIFHLDNGLYFNRSLQLNHRNYFQTFEPRLFYLYVPYENQTGLPNFDTYLLPFTYDQLFSENRFSGYDRLSNANQVSLSFTSRLLSAEDASTKLSFSLGALYYFKPLKVTLDSNDSTLIYDNNNRWSPIVTQLTYYPLPYWSAQVNAAWNTEENQLDNGGLALYYRRDGKHVFTTGYSYVYSDTQDIQGFSNSTNLFYLGAGWPINHRLSALTYFYYDFSQRISRNFILGLQYDACCWAIRVMGKRTYLGDELQTNGGYQRQFKTGVYIQILLKGFNAFGSRSTGAELVGNIPGYIDDF